MKKVLAVLAIVAVILTVSVSLMNAKSLEKWEACAEKCEFEHPSHIYPERYYQCMQICFNNPPLD